MISVVHVVASLHSSAGGPSRSITQLADSLVKKEQLDVTIFSQKLSFEKAIYSSDKRVKHIELETNSKLSMSLAITPFYKFYKLIKNDKPSLIHIHGVWSLLNHWAILIARFYNIPYFVHTRGMFLPNALKLKIFRKKIAMFFYQRIDLNHAKAIITTSYAERDSLRALGFIKPIAIIPNGIELKNDKNLYYAGNALKKKSNRTILFLSRIHPIKGLLELIEAWAKIQTQGWTLKIAGPDTDNHLREVCSLIDKLDASNSVEFIGEVYDDEKDATFKEADLFILPTRSENFGVVIIEALSYGIPVITTHNAPWSDLEKYNCGWWVEGSSVSLSKAIKHAISLEDSQRSIMSLNAREYVKIYSWNSIANDTLELYFWGVNTGLKPSFLYID